jgi:plastocyanin
MDHRTKPVMGLLTVVFVAGVLMLFGCGRSNGEHHGAPHGDGHHMEEDEMGPHHGEEGEHPGNATENPEPSGTIVEGVRVIEMKARKFEFEPERVVVRSGEKLRLKVTSEDVMHGIDIEGYDINKKLPPGETVTIEFTPQKPGSHHFHCSVYCGAGHDQMHGTLVVLEAGGEATEHGHEHAH